MTKKFSEELRTFCETTSVRGIPRILKAKTRLMFFVWSLGVLTCAGVLAWQIYVILSRYFQYPVNTLTVQAPSWQTPPFPDITVCNLSPLVYENQFKTAYKDYLDHVSSELAKEIPLYEQALKKGTNVSSDQVQAAADALHFFSEPTTYLNHFPIDATFSFTENESMVLDCAYFDWSGNLLKTNCLTNIYAAWDPTYYKCFTLTLNNSDRGNIRGMSAVLYIDEDDHTEDLQDFDLSMSVSQATGIRMRVHSGGVFPDFSQGISLGPGTETSVLLNPSKKVRLAQPFSNCTMEQRLPGDEAKYTLHHCIVVCMQQHIINSCGCISSSVPQYSTGQLREANLTICGNASRPDFYQSYACMSRLVADASVNTACTNACVLPCNELHYDAIPSTAPWPQASAQRAFFNTYIQNSARLSQTFPTGPNSTEFIASRFLQLNVQFGDPASYTMLTDVAAFSVDAMGAQIGGVLSLGLGVTVMFAFEAFEFIYIYLTNCRQGEGSAGCDQAVSIGSSASSTELAPQSVAVQVE